VAIFIYLIVAAGHVRFEIILLVVLLYGSSSDYIHECMLHETFRFCLIICRIYSHVRYGPTLNISSKGQMYLYKCWTATIEHLTN